MAFSYPSSKARVFHRYGREYFLKKYPSVSVRLYDAEAFSGKCSDIAVYETDDIQQYYFLIDALRDTEVYTKPYFEIVDIFPAIEDGFVEYEVSLEESA
ncbi:MAG: darcynin family protein [Amphritea sp.]